MFKGFIKSTSILCALLVLVGCQKENVPNIHKQVKQIKVNVISPEMAKVRDYVPKFAVMAHRGSTFWVPEETEAAFRWAREMGADYIEADLQCTKDGVILALHDDTFQRTSNIRNVYGHRIPSTRLKFYKDHGLTEDQAKKQLERDQNSFEPFYAKHYFYEELLALNAAGWYNNSNLARKRVGFVEKRQFISTLEDLVKNSQGKVIKRDGDTKRKYTITGKFKFENGKVTNMLDALKYEFEYENDPKDSGNRPGIYIEFKESWLSPGDFVNRVYNELDRLGMNIITKPAAETEFYKNNKINVGNTNGKVVLQTFSLQSLIKTAEVFKGQVPMCFLLWPGNGATDLKRNDPVGFADFINLAIEYKAHIIGPSIAGAPNNYPELNAPWQAYLTKKAGLLNHPYSFDSGEQMNKYFGLYNYGYNSESDKEQLYEAPYLDGLFTNRTDDALDYLINVVKKRDPKAPQTVPDPSELLDKLGYKK